MHKKSSRIVWGSLIIGSCLLTVLSGCALLYRNRPPIASFDVLYGANPDDPMVVLLDASGSSDPDGDSIVSYRWLFGDDVQILTPLAYSKTVDVDVLEVRYPEEGQYTVTLVVDDEHGAVSQPVTRLVVLPHIEL